MFRLASSLGVLAAQFLVIKVKMELFKCSVLVSDV